MRGGLCRELYKMVRSGRKADLPIDGCRLKSAFIESLPKAVTDYIMLTRLVQLNVVSISSTSSWICQTQEVVIVIDSISVGVAGFASSWVR